MIRKTTLAFATFALVSTMSMSGANADGYWPNYSFAGGYGDCHWEKQKIFVGYDRHGRPIYRWMKVKICN
ncbi:hypothetical protein [Jiella pacifica]|uniref:Uncharacterized protein n=1 Tax=Jiella pacifica TaxID=2696469 RepID=A0A6N9SX70_9HYPH|nr:hypothetical protein [Jiella pacifica]NDW02902.1 hypothetical protein [Jiella pacifica]